MNMRVNFDCQRTQRRILAPGRVIVAETGNNQHQQLLFAGRHVLLADRSDWKVAATLAQTLGHSC